MIPFLQFHALAATRGEGLHPEFLDLFKRQAEQAFINPLRSSDNAERKSKVNSLSPDELAKRAKELADGFSTDPIATTTTVGANATRRAFGQRL